MRSFCQDRLGTNTGNTQKKSTVLFQGGTVILPGSHRGGLDEPAGRLADGYGAV